MWEIKLLEPYISSHIFVKAAIGSLSLDIARERGFAGMRQEELGIQVILGMWNFERTGKISQTYLQTLHEFRFDAVKDMQKKQPRFCHQFSVQILNLICLSYFVDPNHSSIVHSLHRPIRGSGYCGLRPPPITKGRDETARDWWQRRSRTYFWWSSLRGLGI